MILHIEKTKKIIMITTLIKFSVMLVVNWSTLTLKMIFFFLLIQSHTLNKLLSTHCSVHHHHFHHTHFPTITIHKNRYRTRCENCKKKKCAKKKIWNEKLFIFVLIIFKYVCIKFNDSTFSTPKTRIFFDYSYLKTLYILTTFFFR